MYNKNILKKKVWDCCIQKFLADVKNIWRTFRISLIVKRAELDGNSEGNCEIEFKVCYPIIINPF